MPRQRNKIASLPVIEPNAAGIDVGATEIFVAVPADRDAEPIRCFPTFTVDLERLADWLQQCQIRTVPMESTGVYWIPLFQILENRKIDVRLVNAHYVKNVPGRKTDVEDCQWIQHLHSVGLLRGSFRPDNDICALRSLWRHRDSLIQLATLHLQHMQKALDQMNLQIHHVISDLAGTTGLAIMDAILAGERDPSKLAQLRNRHIQASEETIMKSLVGDYREEHLFTLRQSLKSYRHYQELIQEVDLQVKQMVQRLPSRIAVGQKPPKGDKIRRTPWRNEPPQLRSDLYRAFGVDLTEVPGINSLTAQMLLTEIGPNLSRFPTAAAFCSWLRLCPNPKISGGQVLSSRTQPTKDRAALALRMATQGPAPKRHLPRGLLPAYESADGRSEGHDRYRPQARQDRIPHGHNATGIRRHGFSTAGEAQTAGEISKALRPGQRARVPIGATEFCSLGEPGDLPSGLVMKPP